MSDRLAEVMAARTPGPWEARPDPFPTVAGAVKDNGKRNKVAMPPMLAKRDEALSDVRAIVTAVNLWDAHEAIRAAAAAFHKFHPCDIPTPGGVCEEERALVSALAAFDERAKEVVE